MTWFSWLAQPRALPPDEPEKTPSVDGANATSMSCRSVGWFALTNTKEWPWALTTCVQKSRWQFSE